MLRRRPEGVCSTEWHEDVWDLACPARFGTWAEAVREVDASVLNGEGHLDVPRPRSLPNGTIRTMDFEYPAQLARGSDGRYSVTFPDLSDAITQGEDRNDAIEMATDCLAETIGARIAERGDIPVPSKRKPGQVSVVVPVHVAVKAALYVAIKQEDVSLNELARTLEGQPLQVRRLLDPGLASSMKRIDQALSAIGRRVRVSLLETQAQ